MLDGRHFAPGYGAQSASTQHTSVHLCATGSQNEVLQSEPVPVPGVHAAPKSFAPGEPSGFSVPCRHRPRYSGAPAVWRYAHVA